MTKLNLSALKINIEKTDEKEMLKAEETKISEAEDEVEEVRKPTQTHSKKKFSLKELNITGSLSAKEDQNLSGANDVQKVTKNSEKEEIRDDERNEISLMFSQNTDYDPIKEKKLEIFVNYKGSFEKSEGEGINEVDKAHEVIQDKNEKTNLQTCQGQENVTKNRIGRLKNIVLTGLITISLIGLSGFFIIQNGPIKSNVQEVKNEALEVNNSLTKNQSYEKSENIPKSADENRKSIVQSEKHVENTENNNKGIQNNNVMINAQGDKFVKENLKSTVDNDGNPSRIGKRLKDFLIKKYKK